MAKINFSKIEKILEESLQQQSIAHLSELAAIVQLVKGEANSVSDKLKNDIFSRFQKELQKVKEKDLTLYTKIGLTPEDEAKFLSPSSEPLTSSDWSKLKEWKEKILELRRELQGKENPQEEDLNHVETTRIKQKEARFNVNSKWLPIE